MLIELGGLLFDNQIPDNVDKTGFIIICHFNLTLNYYATDFLFFFFNHLFCIL